VNGGNCQVAAANWVHYLHAAYDPAVNGSAARRLKGGIVHRRDLEAEKRALDSARVVICNSERTRRDVIERLGILAERVHVVYYGTDPARFSGVAAGDRLQAKERHGWPADRPLVGFVGALGDRRKAFDTVFDAWQSLCRRADWDADLLVVGSGAEAPVWRQRASDAGLTSRIRFLGFRTDVPDVLAALDALVHPARYEAYGLSVHEALCRGLPAFVSRSAGVAERYPAALSRLLIDNPDDGAELADRLFAWRHDIAGVAEQVTPLAADLRARTWDAMASELIAHVERSA
jgi:glycosyltransferase involved in cell wall biosynthesis